MKKNKWEESGMWDRERSCIACRTGCSGSVYEPCWRPMGVILVWDEVEASKGRALFCVMVEVEEI